MCLPSDALSQHLPSYLGFSYLGHGVSLHCCSSKVQLLLLTLDEGYLLMAAPPDLERGVAPLGPLAPAQQPLLGDGAAPLGLGPWLPNTQERCPFLYRGLECKSKKSRNTWSNRRIWPWSMEWSRAKANRVLPREHTGHSKHPFPTTQEKTLHMDITRWPIPKSDWLYSLQPKMEKLYTVSKNKTWSWLWLRSWTPYCQSQI